MEVLAYEKRIAFLILMVLFLLIGVLSINEIKVEAHEKSEEDMFVIQAEACSANEKLYESFEWCETYIYPQSFAGTFIDYDTLHVLVTDKSAMNYYIEILSDYQCVEYDIVDYSYNELYTDIERTAESLPEEIEIVSYGVDIVKNKAFICVMQDSFAVAKSYIKNNNILVEVSENKIIDETDVIGGATKEYSMTKKVVLFGTIIIFISVCFFVVIYFFMKPHKLIMQESDCLIDECDDITISIEEVFEDKLNYSVLNEVDRDIHFGNYFSIERYQDGKWYLCNQIENNDTVFTWEDIEIFMESGEKRTFTSDWSCLYGKLQTGEYRMIKKIYVEDKEYTYDVNFQIY